jgi:predicted N-acetyltransferase YhbS
MKLLREIDTSAKTTEHWQERSSENRELRVRIRQEQPEDFAAVYQLVEAAFATSAHSDGTEPDYLNEVRRQPTFIPELSLVAEDDTGILVGQIVLYETHITTLGGPVTELVLSPISVHPDYFRRGIARAMMGEAFRIAMHLGYQAVFLCGDPDFYRKFGFTPTYEWGIFHSSDANHTAEWCMVHELVQGSLATVQGTIAIE